MAEPETVDIDAGGGEDIIVEPSGEKPQIIRLPDIGAGPGEAISVLSRLGGITVRRLDGTLLHQTGPEVKELRLRPRRR